MILILSEDRDYSTKDVIDWLIFKNQPFFIIHPDDVLNFKFSNESYFLTINEKNISFESIISVWYRRGWINLEYSFSNNDNIDVIVMEENIHVKNFIYFLLEKKRHINKRNDNQINKLITLDIAKKKGLLVPESFYNINVKSKKQLITKPIAGSASYIENNVAHLTYTKIVTQKELKNYNLAYFQEKIEKKYELRIFYLHGKFWSMAIFSQKDEQTEVDFRRYNTEKPNRTVPFQLPKEIEKKLNNLMIEININSGSIDMIVTPQYQYYFLEVNPIGQFGMTSFPCNYYLEKEIAKFLSYE